MSRSVRELVTEYLDAIGEKRFGRLPEVMRDLQQRVTAPASSNV